MEGYCLKCREKREMKDANEFVKQTKRGDRLMVSGLCVECGTKVFKILGKPEVTSLSVEENE